MKKQGYQDHRVRTKAAQVLDLLRNRGPMCRFEIAHELGYHPLTIYRLIHQHKAPGIGWREVVRKSASRQVYKIFEYYYDLNRKA